MKKFLQATDTRWLFYCPGCGCYHFIETGNDARPRWTFDQVNLTVRPSIVVRTNPNIAQFKSGARPTVCHLYITRGVIEYLPDSTHELKGQLIEMEDDE